MKKIILFEGEKNCCNCSSCENICPKNAISTLEDDFGFRYPKINYDKCISCGLCNKVCAFQFIEERNTPKETYVAVNKNKEILRKSASGGAFTALAEYCIDNDGIVYGATLDEQLNPIHISINNKNDLYKLQGSKYVQSELNDSFKKIKLNLKQGKKVLFSGVPCQVAGLKAFLMKDYDNLLTVDIICHGVPNARFFKDYISFNEFMLNGEIIDFKFRDKDISWEKNGSMLIKKDGKITKRKIFASESSYYYFFNNSDNFRESCYNCKYTCENRPGDITLGDYWGIENAHPTLLKQGTINDKDGISLVITNTIKGNDIIEKCQNIVKYDSDFSKARQKNGQLNHPSKKGNLREKLLIEYKEKGYSGVQNLYKNEIGIKRYKSRIKVLLPNKFKRKLKRYL
ncbi:Coenzyme F420 hydrogenase/dehydrogenase, beta subunit C-terminal domain [Turicibacter sanguinis]|uniref:Coenzyme F420 hydrogenase/dehydrogenase, beta subunit C-terminal domain n=1 Tax=Turicibacter sanguinis TaxID=154288 RepID=UPI0018978010|nr:Coenzyme F420 hydrogenase/dehydrogenase, beta subunit C-terminal domain [Turicibacter sanguinis]